MVTGLLSCPAISPGPAGSLWSNSSDSKTAKWPILVRMGKSHLPWSRKGEVESEFYQHTETHWLSSDLIIKSCEVGKNLNLSTT